MGKLQLVINILKLPTLPLTSFTDSSRIQYTSFLSPASKIGLTVIYKYIQQMYSCKVGTNMLIHLSDLLGVENKT